MVFWSRATCASDLSTSRRTRSMSPLCTAPCANVDGGRSSWSGIGPSPLIAEAQCSYPRLPRPRVPLRLEGAAPATPEHEGLLRPLLLPWSGSAPPSRGRELGRTSDGSPARDRSVVWTPPPRGAARCSQGRAVSIGMSHWTQLEADHVIRNGHHRVSVARRAA